MSISKLQKFPIERQKSFLHIQLLGKNWRQLRSMDSAETVKERYGYLWWIIVASAWFERRRDEDTIQRNKKSQQLEIKQSEANWALFRTCISNEKKPENTIISTTVEGTHRRQKEGKMLPGLCRGCENVSQMKNAIKFWPNAFHFATRNESKVKKI